MDATEQSDKRQPQSVRCMVGANGNRVFQVSAHGIFQLHFGCIPVAGQHLFGFAYRNRGAADPSARRRDHHHPRHLAEGDPGLRIFLQGKNVFDHHHIGGFFREQPEKLGEDAIESFRQGGGARCGDATERVSLHLEALAADDTHTGRCKPGIDAHDLYHRSQPVINTPIVRRETALPISGAL